MPGFPFPRSGSTRRSPAPPMNSESRIEGPRGSMDEIVWLFGLSVRRSAGPDPLARRWRVQELFTAEPAENAENTQWLGELGGERLLSAMFDCLHFLSRS